MLNGEIVFRLDHFLFLIIRIRFGFEGPAAPSFALRRHSDVFSLGFPMRFARQL
jgi:hypothetical protein